jgi:hypothetical protein
MSCELTLQRLKELLRYDPQNGLFYWNVSVSNKCKKGNVAGSASSHGYVQITVDGKNHRGHRLAWFYMMGEWPKDQLDHKNGNRSDNKWANLREASNKFNMENLHKANRNNGCGLLGVHYLTSGKRSRRWMAEIMVSGKHKFLGYHETAEKAHEAYLSAKRELHAGCTI